MAIIDCKNCGGKVELLPDKNYGICESCGSTMTLPKITDDQTAAHFNRGNDFRRKGDYDKALAIYEQIVAEDDQNAEAHWCCALSRFGIEYVEDPATFEYLPTCHRLSLDSFLEDVDYLAALKYADAVTKRHYQRDAAKIAEVQRGILATSQNEKPFDVFICYKETDAAGHRTQDSANAQKIYYELTEQEGYRVFFSRITLEDKAGTEYEPYIFAALNSAKVMLVVGSSREYLESVWVKNEWSRYLQIIKKDRRKLLVPCYSGGRPEDILPDALSGFQSYNINEIGFIQDLTRRLRKVLKPEPEQSRPVAQEAPRPVVQQVVQGGGPNVDALLKRGNMALEDQEWDKAREFFDQVLNMNAECAEAYLGKALIDFRVSSLSKLEAKFRAGKESPETNTLSAGQKDQKRESELISKYTVPGYLESSLIRDMLKYSFDYKSRKIGWSKLASAPENALNSNRNLSRAVSYGDPELKGRIQRTRDNIRGSYNDQIAQAAEEDKNSAARIMRGYQEYLESVEKQLKERHEKAALRRDADYTLYVNRYEKCYSESDYQNLKAQFGKLAADNYKESKKYVRLCQEKIDQYRAEARKRQEAESRRIQFAKEEAEDAGKVKIAWIIAIIGIVVLVGLALLGTSISGWVQDTLIPAAGFESFLDMEGIGFTAMLVSGIIATVITIIICIFSGAWAGFLICIVVAMLAVRLIIALLTYLLLVVVNPIVLLVLGAVLAVVVFVLGGKLNHGNNRIKIIIAGILVAAIAVGGFVYAITWNNVRVEKARDLMAAGKYAEAVEYLQTMKGASNSAELLREAYYGLAGQETDSAKQAMYYGKAIGHSDAKEKSMTLWAEIIQPRVIATHKDHGIAVKENGTVVFYGWDFLESNNVSQWTDIVSVAVGKEFSAGLKSDGSVLLASDDELDREEIAQWRNVTAITAGNGWLFGLKSDGTVLVMKNAPDSYDKAKKWENIVSISAGDDHLIGLKADGTVVAAGETGDGRCNVGKWENIVAISAESDFTMGLKADGTVVVVGDQNFSEAVSAWTDIVGIEAGGSCAIGLKADGTVVIAGDMEKASEEWKNVCQVAADGSQIIALTRRGFVYYAESGSNLGSWTELKRP